MMDAFAQYDKSMVVLKLAGARARKRPVKAAARAASPSFRVLPWRGRGSAAHPGPPKEGLGFDRITVRLNEEGVPSRTGRPGHGFVVNRIRTGQKVA
jgi:hypothetical protein